MEINKQKIITFLSEETNKENGFCDDCLSNKLKIKPRQQVNQICRNLKNEGKISRISSNCNICKNTKILNFINTSINKKNEESLNMSQSTVFVTPAPNDKWNYENEWFEETNISRKIMISS